MVLRDAVCMFFDDDDTEGVMVEVLAYWIAQPIEVNRLKRSRQGDANHVPSRTRLTIQLRQHASRDSVRAFMKVIGSRGIV